MNYVACVEYLTKTVATVCWSVGIVRYESIRLAMGFQEYQKGIGIADHAEHVLGMLLVSFVVMEVGP